MRTAVEPTSRNITIAVSRVVSSMRSRARASSSGAAQTAARTMAPTAPSAPASVGVATPKKMLPSTMRIRASGGSRTSITRRTRARAPRSAAPRGKGRRPVGLDQGHGQGVEP